MTRLRPTDDDTASRVDVEDTAILELDASTRTKLGEQWASRAAAELRVAGVFAVISRDLLQHGAEPALLGIAARAVSDEVRHSDLCRALAERYLGKPVAWPAPGRSPMPALEDAPAPLRATLHTVAMGCINETLASAWLEESYGAATAPAARAVIRELIADDIHHARLGWGHLSSSFVTKSDKALLGAWLPKLLEYAAKPWTKVGYDDLSDGVPAHGVPSKGATMAVLRSTLDSVILPGFDALEVATGPAREWCAASLGKSG